MSGFTLPTPAKHGTLRSLHFTSAGEDQLEAVIGLFFGNAESLVWCIDDNGYHLAASADDGIALIRNIWKGPGGPAKPTRWTYAHNIISWLTDLSFNEALRICGSSPRGRTEDLNPQLRGFTARSNRSSDGMHYLLTVVPAWV